MKHSEEVIALLNLYTACVEWAGKGDAVLIHMPEQEMAEAERVLSKHFWHLN